MVYHLAKFALVLNKLSNKPKIQCKLALKRPKMVQISWDMSQKLSHGLSIPGKIGLHYFFELSNQWFTILHPWSIALVLHKLTNKPKIQCKLALKRPKMVQISWDMSQKLSHGLSIPGKIGLHYFFELSNQWFTI